MAQIGSSGDCFRLPHDSGTITKVSENDRMSGLGEHPWQGEIAQTKGVGHHHDQR
jgi:hypothetical protein